jgi:UDPglucose 6-dehydrogenase
MSDFSVGFAGMTHLGLNSAVGAAEKGFDVVCFDGDAALTGRLSKGQMPVVEPDLPELVAKNAQRLHFTSQVGDLARCKLVYVAPDVATDDRGASDLSVLLGLLDTVEPVLTPDAVAVVLSQVPPGFTRARRASTGANLYYQVETLIFGRAIERTLYPERYIVGCDNPEHPLPDAMRRYLESYGCPILPMRFESAELAKISINMCLIASVGVANMMAELCERVGADWSEIVPSLRLDRRIGQYSYISAGLGIAGGNLERDIATVVRLAGLTGTDAGIAQSWVANSDHRKHWPLRTLHATVLSEKADPLIAVLGLAYKENTASIKNSAAVALIRALHPFRVRAYDPVVKAEPEWHPRLTQTASALEATAAADAVCILTPWPEFGKLAPAELARAMAGKLVLDPYRLLDRGQCSAAGIDHRTLGTSAPTA